MHEELIKELEERQKGIDFLVPGNVRFYEHVIHTLRQDAETIAKLEKEKSEYQAAITALDESSKPQSQNKELISLNIELGAQKLENARLRKAIEDAPCECPEGTSSFTKERVVFHQTTCWKKDALA